MLTNGILDSLDHVAADFAGLIDRFASAGAGTGEQIVPRPAEAGEVGLDVVEHLAAGFAGKTFDLAQLPQFGEAAQVFSMT